MKIQILTFGCYANRADSEAMAGLLTEAGHDIVDANPELLIVNSCFVKGPTERKVIKTVKENSDKKVIVAGCMPDMRFKELREVAPNASLIGTHKVKQIVKVVKAVEKGKRIEMLGKANAANKVHGQVCQDDKPEPKVCLPRIRKGDVAIIPIASGCTGACTYCTVHFVKGKLYSYPEELIIAEAKQAIKDKARELHLTSQDNGAYGLDRDTNLPALLRKLLDLDGEFQVRVGMANPNHVLTYINELIEVYKHPKMRKFLHIPIQSGSDKILKVMNRFYTVEDFKTIVKKFREEIPNIDIATDVICGFPGETDNDFEKTIDVVKETKPEVMNISKYWSRPKTKAAEMEQLDGNIIKARTKELHDLYENYRPKF